MIALIQRVAEARVQIGAETVGQIGPGLLALIGIVPADTERSAERLVERLLDYRVFGDAAGRMNLSLRQSGGGLLLVPQFTLAADTRSGSRPGFSTAAPPAQARALFEALVRFAAVQHAPLAAGRFGAEMQVALINDGPVTFWLESRPEP